MLLKPSSIKRTTTQAITEQVDKTSRTRRETGRGKSYSDEKITPEESLTVGTVTAVITIMSQDLSSIPLILYGRRGRIKYRAFDSPYYKLMHDQPNPEQTSFNFRELCIGHLIGWGNFFAQKIWNSAGDIIELWPLRPDRMTVERILGERIYKYQNAEGKTRIFLKEEILHIPGFGFDGLVGYSRIALARHAIGLSISTEKFGSKFFANGANPGIIYKHPGELTDTAFERLEESLEEKTGVEESHKPMILEEGMSIEKIGVPPDDAQYLETRKFQISEINRLLGPVPPHLIADVSRSTSWGTGIDSQEQGYINHTLLPYGVRVEQNLAMQLLPEQERSSGYFYEHLFDAFLRGDIATRFEAYVKSINNGILTPNQALEKENMNPYKGGDVHWRPANMVQIEPTNQDNQTTANALTPLWRDAALRAVKRETNDLQGASNRWLMHGQKEPFDEWATKFYGQDHPAFMIKQFQPLLEAGQSLLGIDMRSQLESFITQALDDRHQLISFMSAQEITTSSESYRNEMVEKIMAFVATLIPPGPADQDNEFE